MRILVTGANGQLGSEIKKLASDFYLHDYIFTDLPEVDITNENSVNDLIENRKPDFIINCAAYTAVDKAEEEKEAADRINCEAVKYLVRAADRNGSFLIHISTDYVFSGKAHKPYEESDQTDPLSVYGSTKLGGEKTIKIFSKRAMIIRTSWLYSSFGNNFVKTMLRLGKERGEVNVVCDQVGSPTNAWDLAKAILESLPKCKNIDKVEYFHYTNQGVASWYDFARAVFEFAGMNCRVNPILTKDFPAAAKRPFYSVLNTYKFREHFGIGIPYWRDSLRACVKTIITQPR
jgi:dTDP-4-dehydrorhamnose reductase